MAKKKSHHDEDLAVDDEPEAGWTEDTERADDSLPEDPPPAPKAPPPPPPPEVRIQAVIAQLQHHAAHNAPVPPSVIKELQSIATAIAQGPAPTTAVITALEPSTAPEGTIVLVVSGWNFTAESVICYGDVSQNTQVKTDTTQLTATFESGPPGSYVVIVHDPAGDSNEMMFEVT